MATQRILPNLWEKVKTVALKAKNSGAIFSIDTHQELIKDNGVEV